MSDEQISWFERNLKFYLLLFAHIPSFLLTTFILYNFKWRSSINQILGFLLIINILIIGLELPFTLTYLAYGSIPNINTCSAWILINYSLFILYIILTTWTSIERYFFIYFEHFIAKYIIFLHYIPVGCFTLYTPLFYIALVLLYPCEQAFSPDMYICGGPCYVLLIGPGLTDWILNVIIPLITTCIVNFIVIITNIRQRQRMRHSIITADKKKQWRRNLKLSMQLFSISFLCMIGWVPYGVVATIQMFNNSPALVYILSTFFIYFPYAQTIFLPYACILFVPEIKRKIWNIWALLHPITRIRHRNRINIMTINDPNRSQLFT